MSKIEIATSDGNEHKIYGNIDKIIKMRDEYGYGDGSGYGSGDGYGYGSGYGSGTG